MLNLVNQNKQHTRRDTSILQVMTTFLLHIKRLHDIA